jgi:4-hydroxybenzoate polyprenyltransferase
VKTVGVFFLSSRPLSWVNTAFPFAFGYFVVTQSVDTRLVVGALFFLIPYNLLMYGINDVFDYESDIRNPRKGGVEGAKLRPALHRRMVWTAGLVALPFVVWLLAVGTVTSGLWLAFSLFSVIAYSVPGLRFKEKPFLDSATSSAHFVTPAAFGLALAGGSVSEVGALAFAAFFLWGAASHAFGAVQDVVSDREAAIGSIATVIGARNTVRLALAGYVVAGGLMVFAPWPVVLVALAGLPYVVAVAPFWAITDETATDAHRGWRWFLAINFIAGAWVTLVAINAGYLPF